MREYMARKEIESQYPQGVDALLAYWTSAQVLRLMQDVAKEPSLSPASFESLRQLAILYIYLLAERRDNHDGT